MEAHGSTTVLMVVVCTAFLVPIILHKLKWKAFPVVVAEIVVGGVLGKSGLGLIHQDDWLVLLSTLGIIYLMFLSGLEIDFSAIQDARRNGNGPNPLKISLVAFAAILGVSFLFAWGMERLGFIEEPLFLTLLISTISLGVILPVIKERGIIDTPLGQTVLLIAVIADFVTMILLAVYVAMRSPQGITDVMLLLILFLLFFMAARFVRRLRRFLPQLTKETISINTRGVFALILFFVVLSEGVGAEQILGAFLAGVIVSLTSPGKEFVHQLNSFGYGFLIPIFFVMVGANLDIPALLADTRALLLLPLFLAAFYASKLVVYTVLRRHFPRRVSLASSVLLGSTLSLVIAGASIGVELGTITETMQTALILAAVVTTLLSPVFFQSLMPAEAKDRKVRVSLIGINAVTLSLARDLAQDGYDVTVFGSDTTHLDGTDGRNFALQTLPSLDPDLLAREQAFHRDIVVVFTQDTERNVRVAAAARENGAQRVIARVEEQFRVEKLESQGITPFSTFFSNTTLLKAMIEYPTMIKLMSHEVHLQEIPLANHEYHDTRVRDLPFLGDTLIIRVFRRGEVIVPHGDTRLQAGDTLVVSGSPEQINRLRQALE